MILTNLMAGVTWKGLEISKGLNFFAMSGTECVLAGHFWPALRPVTHEVGAGMDRVNTLRKILPEIDELLERRCAILRAIGFAQPIGRRSLATQVQMSERIVLQRSGDLN